MKKRITLSDFYLKYPYKYYDVHSNTVPVPYFPKEEITEHKHTLTMAQWKKIILVYFKYVFRYLLTGNRFKLGNNLGYFQIRKYKPKPSDNIDYKILRETGKLVPYKNAHTSGYKPLIKWDRSYNDGVKLKYKNHWNFKLTRSKWKEISAFLFKNPLAINRFNND